VQWRRLGDHPDVYRAGPVLVRSLGWKLGYIGGIYPMASGWASLEKLRERPKDADGGFFSPMAAEFRAGYFRKFFPFSIWDIKSDGNGARASKSVDPLPEDDEFLLDFLEMERAFNLPHYKPKDWDGAHLIHGWLLPAASDGRVAVYPGDWIVDVGGKRLILSDEEFRARYPQEPDA
jgi:hypothetical protein